MNVNRTRTDGFAPSALYPPGTHPDVNYRATETTELERLKHRLLRERLASETNGELTVPLRRAANEAAALAWVTTHPLLVFPALFEEKARITRRHFERQLLVRARSRELMAA
jgi:hypothetical protein